MPERDSSPPVPVPDSLGPFRVSGVLGEGGSAVVYAVDFEGQEAALKVPRERELTAKEQERFLEEAKMLQRVQHRAVVEVFGAGRLPDGQPYLLMRRYEGETLADHLARSGPLPLRRAVALFDQLAAAVDALHIAGLLHRDLKPENVMLVGDDQVKLLDFGIAKEMNAPASTTTQAGVARGTPATMAPERFFGASASTSTDVYELCVVLYAMLVGRLPWSDVTNVQARLNPLSPDEANAEVPEKLARVVMRGLSTRPERRPVSIAELSADVREAVRGAALAPGRVTADVRISEPAGPMVPQRSDDAQVIESRRDPPRSGSMARWAGLAALVAAVVATVAAFSLGSSSSPAEAQSGFGAESTPPPPSATPLAPVTTPEPMAPVATETAPATSVTSDARKPAAASTTHGPVQSPSSQPSAKPAPSGKPPAKGGKPKGAPCTRSSECASMVCVAETCQ